jgi:hypothetical protein
LNFSSLIADRLTYADAELRMLDSLGAASDLEFEVPAVLLVEGLPTCANERAVEILSDDPNTSFACGRPSVLRRGRPNAFGILFHESAEHRA